MLGILPRSHAAPSQWAALGNFHLMSLRKSRAFASFLHRGHVHVSAVPSAHARGNSRVTSRLVPACLVARASTQRKCTKPSGQVFAPHRDAPCSDEVVGWGASVGIPPSVPDEAVTAVGGGGSGSCQCGAKSTSLCPACFHPTCSCPLVQAPGCPCTTGGSAAMTPALMFTLMTRR